MQSENTIELADQKWHSSSPQKNTEGQISYAAEIQRLNAQIEAQIKDIENVRNQLFETESLHQQQMLMFYNSASWRITRPLRTLKKILTFWV